MALEQLSLTYQNEGDLNSALQYKTLCLGKGHDFFGENSDECTIALKGIADLYDELKDELHAQMFRAKAEVNEQT